MYKVEGEGQKGLVRAFTDFPKLSRLPDHYHKRKREDE